MVRIVEAKPVLTQYTAEDRALIHAALVAGVPYLLTGTGPEVQGGLRSSSRFICIAVKFGLGFYENDTDAALVQQIKLVEQVITEALGGQYTAANYMAIVKNLPLASYVPYNETQMFRANLMQQLIAQFAE